MRRNRSRPGSSSSDRERPGERAYDKGLSSRFGKDTKDEIGEEGHSLVVLLPQTIGPGSDLLRPRRRVSKKKSRKQYHLAGFGFTGDPAGGAPVAVLERCGVPGEQVHVAPVESGKTIPLGANIVRVDRTADGEHYEILEERLGGKGPLKISTPAYRKNWEKIFGKNGVN
jgi:hypothetical protein